MILNKVIGNINDGFQFTIEKMDLVELNWEDMAKRRLRKQTTARRDVGIVRNQEEPFRDGDILCFDKGTAIVLRLQETEEI